MTADQIKQLVDLGYVVGLASEGETWKSYSVSGFGLETHVDAGDVPAAQSLLDTHDERVLQLNETPEETIHRLETENDQANPGQVPAQ